MTIALCLAIAACVAGFVASYFWFRSATVQPKPTWAHGDDFDSLREPVSKSLSQDGWIAGAIEAMSEGAAWDRKGAAWSAAAVLLTGVASISSALGAIAPPGESQEHGNDYAKAGTPLTHPKAGPPIGGDAPVSQLASH